MHAATFSQLLDGTEKEEMPPCIRLDLHDMLAIHKPPGWEMDVLCSTSTRLLYSWPEMIWPNMLCFQLHDRILGFIHRLDTGCSGLLLVSKTQEASFFLH